jgi:hypothetical protein
MAQYFDPCTALTDWYERGFVSGDQFSIVGGNIQTSSNDDEILSFTPVDSDGNRANAEVVVEVTFTSGGTRRFVSGVRCSGNSSGTRTGYFVQFGADSIRVNQFINGSGTAIATVTGLSNTSGSPRRCRLRVNGTTIQARVWDSSGGEPGSWQIDTTDSGIGGNASVGLHNTAQTGATTWTLFGCGTNGDTAPTSAPVAAPTLSDLKAVNVTATTVQATVDYVF